LFDQFGIQFTNQPKPACVRVSGHRRVRAFASEDVDSGVFQAVVTADAGEGRKVEEGHSYRANTQTGGYLDA